jgi:hypothetical protein
VSLQIFTPGGNSYQLGPGVYLRVTQTPSLGVVGQSFWDIAVLQATFHALITMRLAWQGATLNTFLGGPNDLDPLLNNQSVLTDNRPGDPVSLRITMFISSTQLGEELQVDGYPWDPLNHLYNLVHFSYVTGGGGHDPMLDTILDAVTNPYVNAS